MTPAPGPAAALLNELTDRGIELQAHGDRLRYRPRSAVTSELAEQLRAHKPELLVILREGGPPGNDQRGNHKRQQMASAAAPPNPSFRFADGPMEFGDVCAGWTPAAWADELCRKAERCDCYRPDVADYYRVWATDILRRLDEAKDMYIDSAVS